MYQFDPNFNAIATSKERMVWTLYLGLLFFLLYGSANQFAFLTAPHLSIVFDWERKIPFIDIFIIPYMSSDFLFVLALLLSQTRFELKVLSSRIAFLIIVSCFIFVLSPLSSSFEKPNDVQFKFLFDILKADLSFNQMPSLHISLGIILFDSFSRSIKNEAIKKFLLFWIVLICFSTLFVYQHHFIDIPSGMFLAFLTMKLFSYKQYNSMTKRFTTPRGLKMGLYYLSLSVIFILLAFYFNNIISYLFVYLFSSMLLVSLTYAFGFWEVMEEKKYFIFLIPYFLANHFSWLYFKSSLPLFNQIDSNIYFGRMPTKEEYKKLKEMGIELFVNLANDMKFNSYYKSDKSINFLDMTIQDPLLLEDLYLYIKENRDKKIFIHCKFGLSRTIIFIIYYLFKEKNINYKEAIEILKKINSMYKLKAYMEVNAQIYQNNIKENNV